MKHNDLYPGLFLVLVGAGGCILASRLGLGGMRNPGAGLIPFGTAAFLVLMSAAMVARSIISYGKNRRIQTTRNLAALNWKPPMLVLSTLIGYAMALDTLGFDICNFLMMGVLFWTVGGKRLSLAVAMSIITVIGAHLLFITWLNCQFPRGPLGM